LPFLNIILNTGNLSADRLPSITRPSTSFHAARAFLQQPTQA